MNILIVEDERPAAERLQHQIAKHCHDVFILGKTESVEETINWFEQNEMPDLIFMDIQLDDGLCFEIFECVRLDVPVIFTTAYSDYMLKAFKVNSIDYLLKPIQDDALISAVDKYQRLHGSSGIENRLKELINGIDQSYRNRFLIKIGHQYQSIDVADIQYFYIEAKGNYLFTTEKKSYAIDIPFDQLTKMLDPNKFYRINRSCIVNIQSVHRMCAYSSSRLQLIIQGVDKQELLVVSRDKVKSFKRWIDR